MTLGIIGIFLPIMPTVPFLILAAFCFARSNPEWERRILEHQHFGPPIVAWRERGAIGPIGKIASTVAFTGSALFGLFMLEPPWAYLPLAIGVVCGSYILTRPSC